MKYRDHLKEVTRLQKSHAATMRQERSRSAYLLLQYVSDDTLDRIAGDLERMQDAGAYPLIQLIAEIQAQRIDRQPRAPWQNES